MQWHLSRRTCLAPPQSASMRGEQQRPMRDKPFSISFGFPSLKSCRRAKIAPFRECYSSRGAFVYAKSASSFSLLVGRFGGCGRAQEARFSAVAVELLGVGVASRHHRRAFGDAELGLPQRHPVLVGQAVEALDRGVQQFGVGREADVLGLQPWCRPPAGSRPIAVPACRRAACANDSGPSVREGTRAGRTLRTQSDRRFG
jgi:hypothetical protein